MSELPEGWEWTTLGEIGEWFGGGTPSKSRPEFWENGTIPWLSPKDMGSQKLSGTRDSITEEAVAGSTVRRVPAGSVAVVVRSGILERTLPVSQVSFEATLNQDMRAVALHPGIEASWVAHYLRSVENDILRSCSKRGTTVASINVESLMGFRIPLPSTDEQRRIVATLEDHLSRLDVGTDLVERAEARINRFRDRIIADGCTGRLLGNADSYAPPPTSVGLQDGSLPSIPADWKWVRLHEIADVVGGVTKDIKKQEGFSFEEVPFLRVANVQRGRLDLANVTTIRASAEKVAQLALKRGDVLLNEGGDRDKLARSWIWEDQLPLCIHQNHVFRARIRDDALHPKLLAWHANSFGKGWAEANGKQSVNLASISLSKIRQLPVPIPSRETQEEIVKAVENRLDQLDRLTLSTAKTTPRSEMLRRTLLTDAFAGRLVPQNPADQPASELLERIRSEREAAVKTKPKRARRVQKSRQETLL